MKAQQTRLIGTSTFSLIGFLIVSIVVVFTANTLTVHASSLPNIQTYQSSYTKNETKSTTGCTAQVTPVSFFASVWEALISHLPFFADSSCNSNGGSTTKNLTWTSAGPAVNYLTASSKLVQTEKWGSPYNQTEVSTWTYSGKTGSGLFTRVYSNPPSSSSETNYTDMAGVEGIESHIGTGSFSTAGGNYSISETSKTLLSASGGTSGTYSVIVSATAYQITVTDIDGGVAYTAIPCTQVTVAGSREDKNCQATINVNAGSVVDITPKASAPYYWYSTVNASGPMVVK